MSSDIQPGDVVVCVDASNREPGCRDLLCIREGCHYRVAHVGRDPDDGAPVLSLVGVDSRQDTRLGMYCHTRFRKLNDDPDNAELIERIRKCRPMKIGVSA